MKKLFLLIFSCVLATSCTSFRAERVSAERSDELALEITDQWVAKDTEISVGEILNQIQKHRGFQNYLSKLGRPPKLFIGEVQNLTSEAYFPIGDLNDELLTEFSASGEYVLIDEQARERLLKEIRYQNDGMVDPKDVKRIGKMTGADLIIFGAVRMKPETRDGRTIKEYSVNMRMTDIETGVEVLRTRNKINKYSEQSSFGW